MKKANSRTKTPRKSPPKKRRKKIVLSTLAEVAEVFGVSSSAMRYWRENGMPGEPGKWDLGLIVRWTFTVGPLASEQSRKDIAERLFGGEK